MFGFESWEMETYFLKEKKDKNPEQIVLDMKHLQIVTTLSTSTEPCSGRETSGSAWR
jgi:hypothetical protein